MNRSTLMRYPALLTLTWFLAAPLPSGPAWAANVEKQIEAPVRKAVLIEQETQADQVKWRQEREKKILHLETLEKQVEALEAEAATRTERRDMLTAKIREKQQQLDAINQIKERISPFIDQLLAQIKTLREQDLPFLEGERDKRISALDLLCKDPAVPVSEKFRKLMEALMVEAEYGQTVEVYQQTVSLSGEDTLVNIFRLGRLRLFYQTLDRTACGFFNPAEKTWQPLDNTYGKSIRAAIDMASKRKPVELLDLPVGRMVVHE